VTAPHSRLAGSGCGIPTVFVSATHDAGHQPPRGQLQQLWRRRLDLGILLSRQGFSGSPRPTSTRNKEFARQYLAGEVEVELIPQGSLAERLRAGGVGIPAFFTPAGVGTLVAEGGLPWRYDDRGEVLVASPAKEQREFDIDGGGSATYVLEEAIVTDFALVRAWKGDRAGNLVYRRTAQNFNPLCAMAGKVTIAEVEHLVAVGEIDPAEVHTPGVFVSRLVTVPAGDEKRVEKRTTRPRPAPGPPSPTRGVRSR